MTSRTNGFQPQDGDLELRKKALVDEAVAGRAGAAEIEPFLTRYFLHVAAEDILSWPAVELYEVACGHREFARLRPPGAAKVRVVGMRGVAEASLANSFPASRAAERAAYRGLYLGNDPAAYAELSLALARLEMRAADWGAIRAPTLVASGADDFLWPPPTGRAVAALVPGAQFAVLDDAGHFPHLQAPASLAHLVREFLAV